MVSSQNAKFEASTKQWVTSWLQRYVHFLCKVYPNEFVFGLINLREDYEFYLANHAPIRSKIINKAGCDSAHG